MRPRFYFFRSRINYLIDDPETIFEAFASFGSGPSKEMDNSHFSKMLKECKIIGKTFTSTDADLLFSKVKAKEARRISFTEFREKAIPEVAAKMKKTPEEIETMITNAAPKSNSTKADAVRFHDDKSTYTGAAKQGGPTNVDRNAGSLAGVVDRRQPTLCGCVIMLYEPRSGKSSTLDSQAQRRDIESF
ncbi:p25alpha [Leishmania braziliensis]|nr:p25alpha [Leishmania braziliensis]